MDSTSDNSSSSNEFSTPQRNEYLYEYDSESYGSRYRADSPIPQPPTQSWVFSDEYKFKRLTGKRWFKDPDVEAGLIWSTSPTPPNPDDFIEEPFGDPRAIPRVDLFHAEDPFEWFGEKQVILPENEIFINCRGCDHLKCLSNLSFEVTAMSNTQALTWFRDHDLLYRSKLCECNTVVVKSWCDPICVSKVCPACKHQVWLGPPLTDSYDRFTAKQALLIIIGVGMRLSIQSLVAFVGASRPTISNKMREIWVSLSDAHYLRSLKAQVLKGQGDESVFGKRKYGRGRRVNDHLWMQTLVSVDEEGHTIDAFIRPVPNRRADELLPWLRNLLTADATITTDEFRSYSTVCEFANHQTVCHKIQFKSDDGAHTNNAEGFHGLLKREIALRGGKVGKGFVDRARYITALAELLSGHLRRIPFEAQIGLSFLRQIACFRSQDIVAGIVQSWTPRSPFSTLRARLSPPSTFLSDNEPDPTQDFSDDEPMDLPQVRPRGRPPGSKNKVTPSALTIAARKAKATAIKANGTVAAALAAITTAAANRAATSTAATATAPATKKVKRAVASAVATAAAAAPSAVAATATAASAVAATNQAARKTKSHPTKKTVVLSSAVAAAKRR